MNDTRSATDRALAGLKKRPLCRRCLTRPATQTGGCQVKVEPRHELRRRRRIGERLLGENGRREGEGEARHDGAPD